MFIIDRSVVTLKNDVAFVCSKAWSIMGPLQQSLHRFDPKSPWFKGFFIGNACK